ncbi:MAG: histidine--tRNA ligase [Desulfovibrio sp.]|jgi:histidyl-tRNA synthetase|nr:histidine--tRNA ligase [Desulfovibrio sp.]
MSRVTRIKGVADIFPPDSALFTSMEAAARVVFSRFGFRELRTPLLEFSELYARSIGAETDVVQKEMYVFDGGKGRSFALRPEATAGVMRAYIDAGLGAKESVSRLFTLGPMFRHERPQLGRMRQFHQINCECLGSGSPVADAEMIVMLLQFLREIGINGLTLKLNSLGCADCRPRYRAALGAFLASLDADALCPDCARRAGTNPLRVLDCKVSACRELTLNAPSLADAQCSVCKSHFAAVLDFLRARSIDYELDHRLVRGLDYYCRTTFELVSGAIGAQSAVAGGGRYDGLVRNLGGPDVPGVGFACGMERLALLMGKPDAPVPDFFIVAACADAQKQAFSLAQELRDANFHGTVAFSVVSLKSLMRQAHKSGARWCLIVGQNGADAPAVTIKNMTDGSQTSAPMSEIFSLFSHKREFEHASTQR